MGCTRAQFHDAGHIFGCHAHSCPSAAHFFNVETHLQTRVRCCTLPLGVPVKQHSTHLLLHLEQRIRDPSPCSWCRCITTCTLPRLPSKGVLPPVARRKHRQRIGSTGQNTRGGAAHLAVVRMSSTHVTHSTAAASQTSRNHSCCSSSDRPDVFMSSPNRCSSCCCSSTYAEAVVGYGRLQVA